MYVAKRSAYALYFTLGGAEHVLFGSDYPWHLPSAEIGLIKSLDIGEEEKKIILGENAAKLLGL